MLDPDMVPLRVVSDSGEQIGHGVVRLQKDYDDTKVHCSGWMYLPGGFDDVSLGFSVGGSFTGFGRLDEDGEAVLALRIVCVNVVPLDKCPSPRYEAHVGHY